MDVFRIEYRKGSLLLPDLGLYLDPRHRHTGPELVFVSHAHSDHIAQHREVILSLPTSTLMHARIPGKRVEHVLPYGEKHHFHLPGKLPFSVSLFPAGHILGSSLCLVEAAERSLLYTGDFKLRPSLAAESCAPQPADELIMETTFGRPQYVFPPADAVTDALIQFCRETLVNDATPVLLSYSLGKSQELLCVLEKGDLPLVLHESVYRITRIYEKLGHRFPHHELFNGANARGKVLLCPPHAANSVAVKRLGQTRSAAVTGWAIDPSCRYRYGCDAAFSLSDHADFPELLEMVRHVNPKRIYTVHGFAADFAQTLRDNGCTALALSEDDQLSLGLTLQTSPAPVTPSSPSGPAEPLTPQSRLQTQL